MDNFSSSIIVASLNSASLHCGKCSSPPATATNSAPIIIESSSSAFERSAPESLALARLGYERSGL